MKMHILLTYFICSFTSIIYSQETLKDTLFFKYNKKYINTYEKIHNHYYLDDSSGGLRCSFFFNKLNVTNNINAKEILCLKKVVRSSKFYNKKKKKLNDDGLNTYFKNYIIFLVKKDKGTKHYIRVVSGWEIE